MYMRNRRNRNKYSYKDWLKKRDLIANRRASAFCMRSVASNPHLYSKQFKATPNGEIQATDGTYTQTRDKRVTRGGSRWLKVQVNKFKPNPRISYADGYGQMSDTARRALLLIFKPLA